MATRGDLVFLHGFPFDGSSWDPQRDFFSDYSLITPDLRGHGAGPRDHAPWFTHHFVEDLRSLLDARAVSRAVICGISMGGYIALHFAQKYPERVKALVLCDTQAGPDSNEAKDKRYATVQKIFAGGIEAFAEDFSRSVLSEETLRVRPEVQRKVAAMIRANTAADAAQVVATLAARRDATPFLAEIRMPTLVVAGEQDKTIPVEKSRELAGAIAGAELRIISGAGHLPNLEQSDAFNRVLAEFLGKV